MDAADAQHRLETRLQRNTEVEVSGMTEAEFRQRVQAMIVRIITSGASRSRMEAMLRNVHRVERWPALTVELALLEGDRGEG